MHRSAHGIDAAAFAAGWRVLRRHLRYARANPRKLLWIARRAIDIVASGRLPGVLQRHRVVDDIYRNYAAWALHEQRSAATRSARQLAAIAAWPVRPRFSVLMPVYAPSPTLLREAVQSVILQDYREWELCIVDDASPAVEHLTWLESLAAGEPRIRVLRRRANGGIAEATNDALRMATGDFCVFLDQDDLFTANALLEFAVRITEHPGTSMVYGDEDQIDVAGTRSRPFFKPDWDPEWIRTTNYVLHPLAIRTNLLRSIGALRSGRDGAQDWDLVLRASEVAAPDSIEHVPHVLYHWRVHPGSTAAAVYEKAGVQSAQERTLRDSIQRRGEAADVLQTAGAWRIRHQLPPDPPLASIVVCTRDRAELLRRCIRGLRECNDYPRWEAIIIDNGTVDEHALGLLRSLRTDSRFRIFRDERAFNYSALCNAGVKHSIGEVVVLLNNDVEPVSASWLTELVTQSRRPGIGLVGAMLYYPNDTIQHAGVVLGLNGIADRPYIGYPRGFRGVDGRLVAVHTVTAMITACASIRRSTYDAVGGMDESLPVEYNDIDLCLRVADLGLRNILTPFAELYHHESASRGYHYHTPATAQAKADEAHFRRKWGDRLARDPTYNPNLTRSGTAFALGADVTHAPEMDNRDP